MSHHQIMTKHGAKVASGKISGAGGAGSYRSVGTTHDGVRILKPKTKPTHFTTQEIRSTIAQVLRESASGQFVSARPREEAKKAPETVKR